MNQFEDARRRSEARRAAFERSAARKAESAPEEREEQVPVLLAPKKPDYMTVTISGPCEMELIIDYQGTLLSSQQHPDRLKELLTKCLKPVGRVR